MPIITKISMCTCVACTMPVASVYLPTWEAGHISFFGRPRRVCMRKGYRGGTRKFHCFDALDEWVQWYAIRQSIHKALAEVQVNFLFTAFGNSLCEVVAPSFSFF